MKKQIRNTPRKTAPADTSKLRQLADSKPAVQPVKSFDHNKAIEELKNLSYERLLTIDRLNDNIEKYQKANKILRMKKEIQTILLNMVLYANKNACVCNITENSIKAISCEFIENGFILDFIINYETMEVYVFDTDADHDSTITLNNFIKFQSRFLTLD